MSLSIRIGHFLYNRAFFLYKPMYRKFKMRQDAHEIALLKKFIRPGHTILDIGANIGFYAEILSDLAGKDGHVHCFEPDSRNFSHLQKATGGLPNVTLHHAAVGPRNEKITVYHSPELNVDHRTYEPEHYTGTSEVNAVAIDEIIKGKRVDMVKMDIQGFEMEALKGMTNTLNANEHVVLISEFWPYGLRQAGSSVEQYFEALSGMGFKCYLLDNGQLRLLSAAEVKGMTGQPSSQYHNILATRGHV